MISFESYFIKFKILIKILAYFNACNHTNNIGGLQTK